MAVQEGSMFVIPLKRCLVVMIFSCIAAGCSASSGGNGSLIFNKSNYLEVSLSPFYLIDRSAMSHDHAWHMTRAVSAGKPIAGFLKPNQMLMESFTRWIYSLKPAPGKILNAEASSVIVADCKGSYSAHIQMSQNGRFTGQINYFDLADDCSLVFSGEVPFTGRLDLMSGAMSTELTFDNLKIRLGDQAWRLRGELELEFNAFSGEKQVSTGHSDMFLADESGNRFQLDDMQFSWDHRAEYQKLSVDGLIDFGSQGSVRLETTSPLQISNTPGRPNSVYRSTGKLKKRNPAHLSHKRRLPFDGALLFHGSNQEWVRLLFSKPASPGFFWIDSSDGLQTMGTL
jgi:hypothetical protein